MKINEVIKDLNALICKLEALESTVDKPYEKRCLEHMITCGYSLSAILNGSWGKDITDYERLCVSYYYDRSKALLQLLDTGL